MLRIGAHMSAAGGVSHAVDRAALHGCETLQIFSRNASRWIAPPLDPEEVRRFRRRVEETGVTPVVAHASYLINLATTDPVLRTRSIATLADELARAETLNLLGVVLHPGTCTSGTEVDALALVADGVRRSLGRPESGRAMVLLEHTAGQGRTLGYRFEHLASVIGQLGGSPRVGVCLDTCHLTASGYDITTEEGYAGTFAAFERIVGLDRLRVIHANDSKKPCGSRVDRHEHIGRGCLGIEPFRRLLHDPRLAGRPLLIETEKSIRSERAGSVVLDPLDVENLGMLRRLRENASSPGS